MLRSLVMRGVLPLAVLMAMAFTSGHASAQSTTFLRGTVITADGKPASDVTVTATGNNRTFSSTTDASGRFFFDTMGAGTYTVVAHSSEGVGSVTVDVRSQGATVTIALLKVVGSVHVVAHSAAGSTSGTDVVLNQTTLSRLPGGESLPSVLDQLPGAARGANGVVHINGDHGGINYVVDGVPIPQELNREIGTELDPADVSFMDVIEGAYPAQYGVRFAAVVNVTTKVGSGPPGLSGYLLSGSYNHIDSNAGYHTPLGAGSLVANVRDELSSRALDPPNFTAVHDRGSNANQFLRYTLPHGNDVLEVILSHAYQTFQIPNDVAGGEPPYDADNETQDDTFLNLRYHHALRKNGALSYGLAFKRSRIRDFGDPVNDFAYGKALNLAAGGSPGDCANGIVSACAYSLFSDRKARDVILNVDDVVRSAKHEIRGGALYDAAIVQKTYDVTLQPGNFLAPILTPSTPGAATTVVDSAPNVGHTESVYLQDSWRMGSIWQLDYGLRWDGFQVFSSDFDRGFSQLSPRVKLTRLYGPRASVYVYFGRFFTPFSLENVSPAAAQLLNLPLQPTPAQFDLKPQRDSDVEIGGHLPLGPGKLGLRIAQKISTDLIDDTQVGVTALHQDINYARGNISTQSLYYEQPLRFDGRAYASVTHTRAMNEGCETQLLAPCFGAPMGWTPADHDQRWDANGGILLNDARGDWTSLALEYGSGLSSRYCRPLNDDCKVPPHITLDAERGIALGRSSALVLRVQNLFNDRYLITYLNAQGNHYSAGRVFEMEWRFNQR